MFLENISSVTSIVGAVLASCALLLYLVWILTILIQAIKNNPWDFVEGLVKYVAIVLIFLVLIFAYTTVTNFFDGLFDDSPTVYITQTGEKYHKYSCRYLNQSCIPISLKKAQRKGYDACSVCY